MSNVLEQLQARRRHETVLDSGLKVGFHYPDIEECILKVGQIPLAGLSTEDSAAKFSEDDAAKLIAEQPDLVRRGFEFTRALVAAMLDDINGEPVEDEEREAVVGLLDPQERQELFLIATRERDPETGKAL